MNAPLMRVPMASAQMMQLIATTTTIAPMMLAQRENVRTQPLRAMTMMAARLMRVQTDNAISHLLIATTITIALPMPATMTNAQTLQFKIALTCALL